MKSRLPRPARGGAAPSLGESRMRRPDTLGGLFLLLLGLVLMAEAARVPIAWTDVGPGAGFFPFWLSVGVALCGAVLTLQGIQASLAGSGGGRVKAFIPPEARKPLLVAFVPMVLLVTAMRYLGIYLGGGIYLAAYMSLVGRHKSVPTLLVSVLVPVVLFMLFERWFLLPMPKGIILERILYGR